MIILAILFSYIVGVLMGFSLCKSLVRDENPRRKTNAPFPPLHPPRKTRW